MTLALSVDCGKREIWTCSWEDGSLKRLDHHAFQDHNQIHIPLRFEVIAVEEMQVYQGAGNSKGADAEDLLQVQKTVGAVLHAAGGRTICYKPNAWKGQVPKPVMERRIRKRLEIHELTRVEAYLRSVPSGQHHNVWDCIGVGLHYLRRL